MPEERLELPTRGSGFLKKVVIPLQQAILRALRFSGFRTESAVRCTVGCTEAAEAKAPKERLLSPPRSLMDIPRFLLA
jgi:hypothetical protein